MNTTEINGFTIEKFNQYGLDVGKKDQVCPKATECRSSKNHKKKCASADWDRGILTCHHCSETLQLHTFARKNKKNYSKPKANEETRIDPRVSEYFAGRGISEDALRSARVTTSPGWIEFNFYAYGELVNRKSRNGKKQFRLEKNCEVVWYNHDVLFNHKEVIITEGEIDTLSYIEAGLPNVISVPNGASNFGYLDDSIDLFDQIEKVYLSIDNDEAGEKLQSELIRRLGAEKCYTINLPGAKDANEFLVANGKEALVACYDSAEPLPLEDVKTILDISSEFNDFVKDGAKPGFQIGIPSFDDIFSTYTSQFVVVTGIPQHGKSDWIDQMCIGYNQKYNWKIAFASPENKPDYIHMHKIWRKHWGMPQAEEVGSEGYVNKQIHLADNFFHIDMDHFTLEKVLKKASELVKRKGIRCLVIDPYNKIRMEKSSGLSIPEYTMEYLTKIDTWCKKHDCLVILAAHPVKMRRKENGEHEEPTFYDVKGGGEFFDMSYHGLSVYRDYAAKTTKIKVLKVKFQNLGETGGEAYFTWDPVRGQLKPHEVLNDNAKISTDNLPW